MKTKLLILALAALALAGCDDYEAEVAEAKVYCEMVEAGDWPDFKGTYKHCGEVMKL